MLNAFGAKYCCLEDLAHSLHDEQRFRRQMLENGLEKFGRADDLTAWDVGCRVMLGFWHIAGIVGGRPTPLRVC